MDIGIGNKVNKKGRNLIIIIMSLVAFCQLFPLIWLFDFSLCKSGDLFASGILKWPNPPQFGNYVRAWVDGKFLQFLLNSVIVTGVTIIVTAFLALTLGYAFTRMQWKFKKIFLNLILLGMMIPIHATLLPNFIVFNKIGLNDSYLALILPYIAFSMPISIFIMTGFMESIPKSLEESAVLDGCGIYGVIFRIIAPITKPAIVSVAILTFLSSWNEFIMAVTYLSSDKFRTLPFSVMNFAGQYSSDYAIQFAVMALTALPALLVYILFNEQITKGVTAGAVKG
jgi:raffinose/stachyose/melibiose transport system permease protein